MTKWLTTVAMLVAMGFSACFASAAVMNTTKGMRLTILPVMGATKEEEPAPKGKVRVAPVAVNKATSTREVAQGSKGTKARHTSNRHKAVKPSAQNKG
ncbi:MAG: hypothetical protein AB7T14_02075 [Candidatus Methylacidiphilaceae bacterium]